MHKDSRLRKSLISKAQLDEAKGHLDNKLFFQGIAQKSSDSTSFCSQMRGNDST
ncbi:hypothetical protein DPMN_029575 [Dreissena polymorpha]|uniref:Uncharacterized protein n=1 Tax=Dreissena polymorpha TaxID=45954 RepID=A0A9D4RFE5_DREPO|nr:hypothetical protein DPMN_029575 [Dreissena polymorpha]